MCTENIRMRLKVCVFDIQKRNSDVFLFFLKNMLKFSVVPWLDRINFVLENCLTQRERKNALNLFILEWMEICWCDFIYLNLIDYSLILMHFPFQCDFCFRRKTKFSEKCICCILPRNQKCLEKSATNKCIVKIKIAHTHSNSRAFIQNASHKPTRCVQCYLILFVLSGIWEAWNHSCYTGGRCDFTCIYHNQ